MTASGPASGPKTAQKLRVCTWNVLRTDRESRKAALIESLTRIGADVLCLQETSFEHSEFLGKELGMNTFYAGNPSLREAGDIGVALLSRTPFVRQQAFQLSPAAHENLEGRAAALAVLEIGSEERVFASAHLSHTHLAGSLAMLEDYRRASLDWPGANGDRTGVAEAAMATVRTRMAQLDELLGHLAVFQGDAVRSVLVAGDFNAPQDGPEYRTMIDSGFRDSWRSGPRLGSGATIIAANPFLARESLDYEPLAKASMPGASGPWDYCLDYQFVTGSFQAGAAWTVGHGGPGHAWPSDHLGIVVDYS